MTDSVLFFAHYAVLLLFGVFLSFSFAGIALTRKNVCNALILFALCGVLQLALYFGFNEALVWQVYPLITHLPIVFLLLVLYRKRVSTTISAVASAYMCCQTAKWIGVLVGALTQSILAEKTVQIAALFLVGIIVLRVFSPFISALYIKDNRSVWIFGCIPIVFYLYDYLARIYTDFWTEANHIVIEFLPFLLCVAYMLFCVVYYKEYELKLDAQRKENIIQITVEQQAKEMEAIRRSEHEIRLIRHDMRLFLNNLSLCLGEEGIDAARGKISAFVSNAIDSTVIHRYSENNTINYVLSDCAVKCQEKSISFEVKVDIHDPLPDEIMLSSILSNALDNSINALEDLPEGKRSIKMLLKTSDGRLLLSVKNPLVKKPDFVDGLPISRKEGHGYGTQSIRYLTERLGGNCLFAVENNEFVLRVAI